MLNQIAFLDTETTGLDKNSDQIIELCIIIADGYRIVNNEDDIVQEYHVFIKPSVDISAEASDIHHITNEKLIDCLPFSSHAKLIQDILKDKVIAGHNVEFDIEILNRQLVESGEIGINIHTKTIDTLLIEKLINSHKLTEVYKRYFGKEIANAHSAKSDVLACIEILKRQIKITTSFECADDIYSSTVKETLGYKQLNYLDRAKCFYNADGEVKFAFGMHKGKNAKSELKYLNWMLNGNFSKETKSICTSLIEEKHLHNTQCNDGPCEK